MDVDSLMKNGMVALMIGLGHRFGLFKALNDLHGTCTPRSLAEKAKLNERQKFISQYVQEWLGAMVVCEIVEKKDEGRYNVICSMDSILSSGVQGELLTLFGEQIPAIKKCFSSLKPIGYTISEFPYFITFMDRIHRLTYTDKWLHDNILYALKDLPETFTILDFGCGTGIVSAMLAEKYPSATVYGIDVCQKAIRCCEESFDFPNLKFHLSDADLKAEWYEMFDLVILVDVLHDLSDPEHVLTEIKRFLKPDGLLITIDPAIHSDPSLNVGDNYTIQCYMFSLMNCLPSSMANSPHAGLGPGWGYEAKVNFLEKMGFQIIEPKDADKKTPRASVACRKN